MQTKTRLTMPLLRVDGELSPASWDEALDRAAEGLGRMRDTSDATTSFGIFSCSKATNEMNFLAQKFARQVMGTNNIDSCNRTGQRPASSVWRRCSERAAARRPTGRSRRRT